MRSKYALRLGWFVLLCSTTWSGTVTAQPAAPASREATIIELQRQKATVLHPRVPDKPERLLERVEAYLTPGKLLWHPYFISAYSGGGFTLGAGRLFYVSPYNTIDVRGSYTLSNYKRIEAEFRAPRLFNRHGRLSVIGGWREATQVGFFGIGTPDTSKDDRVNYSFSQPYTSATLDVRPWRLPLFLQGGVEYSQWSPDSGSGSFPSIETVYTPATLPGLGAEPTYLHTKGAIAFDTRTAVDYTRRGGYYGVTWHDFSDSDDAFGFRQTDLEAIQHIPILRDAWVLSLRARVESTDTGDDQQVPFFMLPALGGGSSLRGFSSWRFRDLHSILLSAEWRVLVNRFIDTAIFVDAGKVVPERKHLDLQDLKSDVGIGFRFHGPVSTPLRIEFAHSNEGLVLVFSASSAF
jgi:hypothetical protein